MTYSPLDLIEAYLRRFVAYPSEHALVAHVLWIAHTHLIECFDTTPRLAFMSAEKESGKTRALELTALFVPDPILSISASPAVIVRLVSAGKPTILYDEIDGVFGNARAQEANTDLRSVLNGGYRRGAKVHRCTNHGKKVKTEELDAFAPVAVAGLRELPDTLASRAIFIRMKRRAPDEQVESFRHRYHCDEAKFIKEALADWCAGHDLSGAEPEKGIEDRAADCWEPLIAIADEAGADWPNRARNAATYLTGQAADETLTSGVELLGHTRDAFGDETRIATVTLLEQLLDRDESPWKDIRGKPLDERGLARRLKAYGIKSKVIRIGDRTPRGYLIEDFADAWRRYLPPPQGECNKRNIFDNKNNFVADVADVADISGKEAQSCPACDGSGCPWCQSFEGRRENLNQANKLSRTYATSSKPSIVIAARASRRSLSSTCTCTRAAKPSSAWSRHRGVGIDQNQRINPMQSKLPMHLSLRCGARTRSGSQCRSPAMPNGRCRMHGGKSPGAPKGNKNSLKHGHYAAEAIRRKREVGALLRVMRALAKLE